MPFDKDFHITLAHSKPGMKFPEWTPEQKADTKEQIDAMRAEIGLPPHEGQVLPKLTPEQWALAQKTLEKMVAQEQQAKSDHTTAMQEGLPLQKIISGGQTGADRAALDAALDAKFPCGGWCPKGRKAEDGRISSRYPLQEINSKSYAERTRRNIEEADGTLLVTFGEPAGGSAYTLEYAIESGATYLHVDANVAAPSDAARLVADWIREHRIATLNIAGPRASKEPAIYMYTYDLIARLESGVNRD